MLVFMFLFVCTQSTSIIGSQAAEQFLFDIYEWLKEAEQQLDQNQAFHSLEQMVQLVNQDYLYEVENQEFLKQFEQQMLEIFETKVREGQRMDLEIEFFIKAELHQTSDYLHNMIKDKIKMIEQDSKQLAKIKGELQQDKSKIENKFKEITYLLKEIETTLESRNEELMYKLLEIIESKAVIGLFQTDRKYIEIEQFLSSVDRLFKQKNYAEDQFEIINLLSIIQNILQDMRLNLLMTLQEEKMSEIDVLTFYESSKSTHTKAKNYFEAQLHSMQVNLVQTWEQLKKEQKEEVNAQINLLNWFKNYQKLSNQSIDSVVNKVKLTELALGHMESNFLQMKKRQ